MSIRERSFSTALTFLILIILCRFVDRDMTMRFHPGLGVGHPTGSRLEMPSGSGFGDAMEVDIIHPTIEQTDGSDATTDSDYTTDSSEEESDSSRGYGPEPDSEEEPEIYG